MKAEKLESLRRAVELERDRCMGRGGSALSQARESLKGQYLGAGYGVDAERRARGFSTYVDRTVMETVEWAKPGLMRVFCTDEIIRFDPRTPEQEQAAEDATLYVNQVVFGRNMFSLVHDVLSDGLYQRAGWCLVRGREKVEEETVRYEGLSREEAEALLTTSGRMAQGGTAGETEGETSGGGGEEADGPFFSVQRRMSAQGEVYDVAQRMRHRRRDIALEPVPPEQVLISADAPDVESARFVGYWQDRSASELRAEGFDEALMADLPAQEGGELMPETRLGLSVNEENVDFAAEHAEKRFRVYEAWLDFDLNGDGLAEKVRVTFCGDEGACRILKAEPWPLYRAPLFAACSVPLPHQAVGLCLADLVSDVQDLRTEMTRQYLDALALANQGELVVSEGMNGSVEYDSLLARGVGAVHRVRGDASITPLPVTTGSAEALEGLNMSAALVERRTGVSSRTQSLQADALQNTATGAVIMEEAVNQRLELIARVYAETFFRPLGRYILHLLHRCPRTQSMRLKGRFVRFEPARWDPDMDISVAVGLGTGNRTRLLAAYRQILQIQQSFLTQLGAGSPVRLSHIIYTCRKMCEAAGLEAPERFFGTEEDAARAEAAVRNAPAKPSPEQQKLQFDQQKAQEKQRTENWKAQTEARRKALETQGRLELERRKTEGELALKALEIRMDRELDGLRADNGGR